MLRLIKLVRLLRATRLFTRWQSSFSVSHALIVLTKCVTAMLLAGHWFACLIQLQTKFLDTPLQSWLGFYEVRD